MEAVRYNGIKDCPYHLFFRILIQRECHAVLKSPVYARENVWWKDVTFGVSRECVRSASVAAEQIYGVCRR
jgi:hypothetical protein